MNKKYTKDIVALAYYGIDEIIDEDATVSVSLRDLMRVYGAISELVRFFHQPLHMQSLEDVEEYLGVRGSRGAMDLLFDAQYEVLGRMLPSEIDDMLAESAFHSPILPYYFEEK